MYLVCHAQTIDILIDVRWFFVTIVIIYIRGVNIRFTCMKEHLKPILKIAIMLWNILFYVKVVAINNSCPVAKLHVNYSSLYENITVIFKLLSYFSKLIAIDNRHIHRSEMVFCKHRNYIHSRRKYQVHMYEGKQKPIILAYITIVYIKVMNTSSRKIRSNGAKKFQLSSVVGPAKKCNTDNVKG